MEIKKFAQRVCKAVGDSLGDNYNVELKEVRKNNDVLLHGLTIQEKDHNVAPTIYLEHFWKAYEEGASFSEVIDRLLIVYGQDGPACSVDMDFFRDFEKVRDRICYRLIGSEENEILLEDIPHVEFLDLAVCFFYAYNGPILGEGSILVHNSHMKAWGSSIAELMSLARENTPRLFPSQCSTMEEVLEEITDGNKRDITFAKEVPMKVLTNNKRLNGAVCMIYQGILEHIAEELGASLYILPSSIHEVILLAGEDTTDPRELKKMIMEVNSTQVAPEEVLSNSLYRYDRFEKRVEKIL